MVVGVLRVGEEAGASHEAHLGLGWLANSKQSKRPG